MKQKLFLMIGVGAAMALTSCTDNDNVIDNGASTARSAVNVLGTVGSLSRAVDNAWDANDQIGLSSAGMMDNKPYVTLTGDGAFNAVGDTDYYMDADTHTFTAYSPYQTGVTGNTIAFTVSDVATVAGQKGNDYLWATGTGSAKIPGINMNFAHKMTRVILNVTTNTEDGFNANDIFGTADGSTIVSSKGILNAAFVTGEFNTLTGKITTTQARSQFVMNGSDLTDTHVRKYVMILPEQESCNYKHIFNEGKTNEQVFTAKLESQTWKAGFTYTYNIVIGRNGAYVAKSTIENWTDGGTSDNTCQPA
jgi:hypothetical protein